MLEKEQIGQTQVTVCGLDEAEASGGAASGLPFLGCGDVVELREGDRASERS